MSDARLKMSSNDRQALDEYVRELVDGSIITKATERFLAQVIAEIVAIKDAEIARAKAGALTDQQIKQMSERFLRWQLPDDFNPDGGVNFKRVPTHTPTGTNLFTYTQAEKMVRHMVDGLASTIAKPPQNHEPSD